MQKDLYMGVLNMKNTVKNILKIMLTVLLAVVVIPSSARTIEAAEQSETLTGTSDTWTGTYFSVSGHYSALAQAMELSQYYPSFTVSSNSGENQKSIKKITLNHTSDGEQHKDEVSTSPVSTSDADHTTYTFTGEVTSVTFSTTSNGADVTSVIVYYDDGTYSVTLTGGGNATASGSTSQTVTAGQPMTDVIYTADTANGFFFNDFTPKESNGVTASKTSRTTVTVSGTPTGDVEIEIPNAVDGLTPITDTVMVTFSANGGTPGEFWPEEPESFPVGPFDLSIFWSIIDNGSLVSAPSGYHCSGITFTDSEGVSKSYDYGSTESHSLSKDSTLTFNWEEEDKFYCSSGDGQTYQIGSSAGLDFVFKRTVDDKSTFDSFVGIEVDGSEVPEKTGSRVNYVTEPGSVKIKLQPAYLDELSEGKHTLTAVFTDKKTADATFTITKKSSGGGSSSSDTVYKIPRTGID